MKFYRYDDTVYADIGVRVNKFEYELIRETPKGYWINAYGEKWISKTAKKRFAYPTEEEALESFKARKKRQIEILEYQLRNARMALYRAERN